MKHTFIVLATLIALVNAAPADTIDSATVKWGDASTPGLQAGIAGPSAVGFRPRTEAVTKNGITPWNSADLFRIALRNAGSSTIRVCSAPPYVSFEATDANGSRLLTQGFGGTAIFMGPMIGFKEDIPPGGDWSPAIDAALVVLGGNPTPGVYSVRAHITATVCNPDRNHTKQVDFYTGTMSVSLGGPNS